MRSDRISSQEQGYADTDPQDSCLHVGSLSVSLEKSTLNDVERQRNVLNSV